MAQVFLGACATTPRNGIRLKVTKVAQYVKLNIHFNDVFNQNCTINVEDFKNTAVLIVHISQVDLLVGVLLLQNIVGRILCAQTAI